MRLKLVYAIMTMLVVLSAPSSVPDNVVPISQALDHQTNKDAKEVKDLNVPLWIFHNGQAYLLPITPLPDKEKTTKAGAAVSIQLVKVPVDFALPVDFVLERIIERIRSVCEDLHFSVAGGIFGSRKPTMPKFHFLITRKLDIKGCRFYEVATIMNEEESRFLIGLVERTVLHLYYHPKNGVMTKKNETEWKSIVEDFNPKEHVTSP